MSTTLPQLSDDDIRRIHYRDACLADMVGSIDQWPEILRFARAVIAAHEALKGDSLGHQVESTGTFSDAVNVMKIALQRIERWHGEFPKTGETWESGEPVSYGSKWGSVGERDYMRALAKAALTAADRVIEASSQMDKNQGSGV